MTIAAQDPGKSVSNSKPLRTRSFPELQLFICTIGIYACYLRYGVLQERIYATEHGSNKERFSFSLFLVAVQTATNAAAAAAVLVHGNFRSPGSFKPPTTNPLSLAAILSVPISDYLIVSLFYLSATVFSFTALNYMSYPMQAVGKSCKMIPVMLMGVVIRRRRYSLRNYLCVALVTLGVANFSWKSKTSAVPASPLGFALLLASLFMDGITGPLQERLVDRHSPSAHQLMFWQNVGAVLWLAPACLFTGEGVRAILFVTKYPHAITDIMSFSLVSALGQNFIYYTIRNFSALTVTTITTTRKMLTVLLSIILNKHSLSPRQWIGLLFVFVAITWEAVEKQRSKIIDDKAVATSNKSKTLYSLPDESPVSKALSVERKVK